MMRELKQLLLIFMIMAALLAIVPLTSWASYPQRPSQWQGSPGSLVSDLDQNFWRQEFQRQDTKMQDTKMQELRKQHLRSQDFRKQNIRKEEPYRKSASSRETALKRMPHPGQESYRRQETQWEKPYQRQESYRGSESSRNTAWKRTTPNLGQESYRRIASQREKPYQRQESSRQQEEARRGEGNSRTPAPGRRVEKPKVLKTCAVIPEGEMAEIRGCMGDSYYFALDIVGNINIANGATNFNVNFQANVPPGNAPQLNGTTAAFSNGTVNFQAGAGTSNLGTGIFQVVQVAGINNIVIANTNVTLNIQGLTNLAGRSMPISNIVRNGIGGLNR